MLVKVLDSISTMLEDGLASTNDIAVAKVYFKCAKTLLDKTIQNINEGGPQSVVPITVTPVVHKKVEAEEIAWIIDADKTGIKKISWPDGTELDEGRMVELDGIAMTYKMAKGKPCKNGRVL